ncbi:Hsp70 family protein [Rhodoferax saidenbachensis]|uniref:Chaperone protein n=1 Tax=Rhodoferax saidenbachensis TaxID=1484693 RepID=A0ABU1ZS44_9BURK|nr:Hsp70 family protein [Rhodoferax saidenbachensis]MDR7308362.1 putative chaperone protein [Rhodoferax saidenbachensis]
MSGEQSRPLVLGIDFGTSNSAAALIDASGVLQVIPLDGTRAEMPTALFFASETHTVLYGAAAMQAYLNGTEGRLLRSLKSLLGSRLMDEYTAVGDKSIRFFDIVVLFFKELKRRCEAHVGQPLTHAVLGRPVHFVDDDAERDLLAQETLGRAALEAGFTHIAYQMEPIAAALDYEQRVVQETTALVVDIGGGTSDFTVIRLNPVRSTQSDRSADILATTGVHIGGTDFDRLLDLGTVMPHLGYKHVGTGGRIVPNSVFFDLSTWHLIHQAYTRKALHFAKELWTDYTDQTLHRRLMDALEEQHGHRMLAGVEAAKIACSISGDSALVDLAFLDHTLTLTIDAHSMELALHTSIAQVVRCAQDCVAAAGLQGVDAVYLTGGSSALRTLIEALRQAMPQASLVEGNRFGGVAAGLAWAGAVQQF